MKNKTEKALPENVLKEGLGKTDFKTDKVCADAENLSPSEGKIDLRKNAPTDKNHDCENKKNCFRACLYPSVVAVTGITVAFIRAGFFIAQYAGGAFDYFTTLISDILLLFLFGALAVGGVIIAIFCFLSGKKRKPHKRTCFAYIAACFVRFRGDFGFAGLFDARHSAVRLLRLQQNRLVLCAVLSRYGRGAHSRGV